MRMKKALYLMGIDWYWIKQRPQMIAIELEKDYDLTVVYLSEVFKEVKLQKGNEEVKRCKRIPAIPFRDKNRLAFGIERLFFRKAIGKAGEYDLIWITHPTLFKYIDVNFKGTVVYDCMDNHKALCSDIKIKKEIEKCENQLIKRADIILATSQVLKNDIEGRAGTDKVFLIRNGYHFDKIYQPKEAKVKENYKIGYIGTIAEWLDLASIQYSLTRNLHVEYHLIGPIQNINVDEVEGITLEGVIEHKMLYDKVKEYDCLIMPFIVNDIVLSVDPVKLYEYISMGKCIISVYYKEIAPFEPFVYFYSDKEQLIQLIDRLGKTGFPPKYTGKQQKEFLSKNTWTERYKEIADIVG